MNKIEPVTVAGRLELNVEFSVVLKGLAA